jgi:hypothetical protein
MNLETEIPKRKTFKAISKIGSFKNSFDDIFEGPIHFSRASKVLRTIHEDKTIKNVRNRYRKHSAQSLDSLMQALTVPITKIIDSYNNFRSDLHPYEVV